MVETIHPKQIESELDRIWKSFQGTNKMRACLFNLIIYSKKCQRIAYLNEVVQSVIQKFPSRIIFITYDENGSNHDLKTSVSILTADEGENAIACDMIELDVGSKDDQKVPFVMLPHILPDLPIYLIHADDPIEKNPIAKKLEHFATRIIFDSKSTTSLPRYAQAVLTHRIETAADIADFNWALIEGWRQLFANIFHSGDSLESLRYATEMQINFNSNQSSSNQPHIQSIYLQAWIASQLDWKLKKATCQRFTYQSPHHLVEVHLIPSKMDNIPFGRILGIEIQTEDGFHCSMKRNPKCPYHVIIEKANANLCSIPFHFMFDKDLSKQSLVKEICHQGTSEHYIKMLTTLSQIKNESLCQ